MEPFAFRWSVGKKSEIAQPRLNRGGIQRLPEPAAGLPFGVRGHSSEGVSTGADAVRHRGTERNDRLASQCLALLFDKIPDKSTGIPSLPESSWAYW